MDAAVIVLCVPGKPPKSSNYARVFTSLAVALPAQTKAKPLVGADTSGSADNEVLPANCRPLSPGSSYERDMPGHD